MVIGSSSVAVSFNKRLLISCNHFRDFDKTEQALKIIKWLICEANTFEITSVIQKMLIFLSAFYVRPWSVYVLSVTVLI